MKFESKALKKPAIIATVATVAAWLKNSWKKTGID